MDPSVLNQSHYRDDQSGTLTFGKVPHRTMTGGQEEVLRNRERESTCLIA